MQSLRTLARSVGVVAVLALGATVVAPSSSGASAVTHQVVTFAELPAESPNFIFPFTTAAYYGVSNLNYLQHLMFRPLYSYGNHGSVTLDKSLSLASTPVFSNNDKTVKITLKPYKWSNGTSVSATDVLFWLNIWKMKPTGFGAWFPGGLSMPTSITSFRITSPTTFTITYDHSFNPIWLTNELALITPLPVAWTKTSPSAAAGSAGCAAAPFGSDAAACKAVYTFLSEQSGFDPTDPSATINALPTYATNPLWKVVDGPWTLASFGPTAPVVFKPNPTYSGPNKPKVKEFIEKPFAAGSAEFNALVSGGVDIGYLPTTDITSDAARAATPGVPVVVGKNNPRLATYTLSPLYPFGNNYFPENFKSTGDAHNAGPIFDQLYFRQAFQDLVDQTLYVKRIFRGYAVANYGPVPTLPKNKYASKYEETNPYPYNPPKAKALLSSHGWKVVPGGVSTCVHPGAGSANCGKGVKKGAKLSFTLLYASGTQTFKNLMTAEKASWAQAGIHVSLSSASYDDVIGTADPCPKGCSWEMGNWLAGWTYTGSYPTAQAIFESGAPSNSGSFTTAKNNQLIEATVTTKATLTQYENYEAKVLPAVWQPRSITLVEVHKGLEGVTPMNPLYNMTPATFHWQ
jgi:peptide/nickel transport system substrate-binding protein